MTNFKVLIVISKYYKEISDNLLNSAIAFIQNKNVNFDILEVPGALEIPQAINLQVKNMNSSEFNYDGYIALGCVIRGETYHFEIVSNETNRALMNVAINNRIPIGNGVITTYNYDQALKRSCEKGHEASKACLELIKIDNTTNSVDQV